MGPITRYEHFLCKKKKPVLSPLSTETWSGSEKVGGGQQMIPELLNEVKATKQKTLKMPQRTL